MLLLWRLPRKRSPLLEEMPDRAEEYSVPLEKAPVGCALCWDVPKGQGDIPPALRATSLFKGDKRLLCPAGHLVLSGPLCHLR